jgi:hypothetical protein
MTMSGPWKPLGVVPTQPWMSTFPSTVTLPFSRTELQRFASILPPIVEGSL